MLNMSTEELVKLGGEVTTREIKQQPELWDEVLENFSKQKDSVESFLNNIKEQHASIKVIFTGAGTSAYVGEVAVPYLSKVNDQGILAFEAVATTDIVSNPDSFYSENVPTLLVSFARSGNSPESVAAVELGKKLVKDFYQVTITCNPEGALAKGAEGDDKNIVLLQPERSNDQGLAMTGSFSCMLLTALLAFDKTSYDKKVEYAKKAIEMGNALIERVSEVTEFSNLDYHRVIYLGSGGLLGLAHESRLKLLELTAGIIATDYESSLGFRHGPKSFIDDRSLAIVYVSNDPYTRKYDLDIIEELRTDQFAQEIISVYVEQDDNPEGASFKFSSDYRNVPDAYLALGYVMFAQTLALLSSVKVDLEPDNPSPSGAINRVVKGVTIHDFE